MTALDPCASCRCHIKRSDETCPFCRADNAKHAVALPRGRRSRMSRRELVAIGSAFAVAACSSPAPVTTADASAIDAARPDNDSGAGATDAPSPERDAAADTGFDAGEPDAPAPHHDAAADAHVTDAAPDSAVGDAGVADGQVWACPSHASFTCGSGADASICSAATDVCLTYNGNGTTSTTCEAYGGATLGFPAACGPCPTCACLSDAGYSGPFNHNSNYQCTEGDAGEMAIVNYWGCYGAPPARPERMAA